VARVTRKLQVTIPKSVVDEYRLKPGDELIFEGSGDVIRVVLQGRQKPLFDVATRLKLFDQATQRQRWRESRVQRRQPPAGRGWTREELYERRTR
jgi:AbrB family looped-hinge helix DNA binding protein